MSAELDYLVGEVLVVGITLFTLARVMRHYRQDRRKSVALSTLVYSAHVLTYYTAVMLRRQFGVDWGFSLMPWSLALRLHCAVMVLMFNTFR